MQFQQGVNLKLLRRYTPKLEIGLHLHWREITSVVQLNKPAP
jgi:hypothetical protein